MLKAYIEQIIPCAYTILGIESFIIFSMCFRHPKALVSAMPALIAFWNIGMCTGHRADNGKLYQYLKVELQIWKFNYSVF